jgi:copper chaperone CopZ
MNMFKSALLALSLTLSLAAPATAQPNSSQTAPIAADVVVSVNGMVCDFCAQSIERSLRRRQEVNAVRVNLSERRVTIDFHDGRTLDDATIRQIITNAGYTVTGIERTGGGAS